MTVTMSWQDMTREWAYQKTVPGDKSVRQVVNRQLDRSAILDVDNIGTFCESLYSGGRLVSQGHKIKRTWHSHTNIEYEYGEVKFNYSNVLYCVELEISGSKRYYSVHL